ncbi:MAG: hypothetical protein QM811_24700 [Pirellulales bacterium]
MIEDKHEPVTLSAEEYREAREAVKTRDRLLGFYQERSVKRLHREDGWDDVPFATLSKKYFNTFVSRTKGAVSRLFGK